MPAPCGSEFVFSRLWEREKVSWSVISLSGVLNSFSSEIRNLRVTYKVAPVVDLLPFVMAFTKRLIKFSCNICFVKSLCNATNINLCQCDRLCRRNKKACSKKKELRDQNCIFCNVCVSSVFHCDFSAFWRHITSRKRWCVSHTMDPLFPTLLYPTRSRRSKTAVLQIEPLTSIRDHWHVVEVVTCKTRAFPSAVSER